MPASGDERHRLQRLQRAARHRDEVRIAGAVEQSSVDVDDGDATEMNAFDGAPARFDRERRERADVRNVGGCVWRGLGHDGCGVDNPPFYRPVESRVRVKGQSEAGGAASL